MATRENQGLQIALILFVMITVALAISTYVYFRKAEEKFAEATSAQEATSKMAQQRDTVITENQKLKAFMGYDPETNLSEVQAGFDADITLFMADYGPDAPRNYRTLPPHLLQAVYRADAQIADASIREQKDEVTRKQVVAQESAKTAEAEKAHEAEKTKVAALDSSHKAERVKWEDKSTKLAAQNDALAKEKTSLIAIQDQKETEYEDNLETVSKQREAIAIRVKELTKTTFETADGQVTWVSQTAGKVTIDVGLLDGVRPQTAFKIYPPGENSYEVENSKGTIEVISILDKHRAEARIISDETTNPILPGDFIYTPLWRPGTNVRFALAGMIDLDDDAQSDRSLIRNLITMNSGIIDAEVDETGKRSGKLTVDTRYLVVGKRPTETTDTAALEGYTNMQIQAENLGIEQITVDKLLDYLNYRGTERSVKLGKGANPNDFKAQPVDGVNRSSTGDNAFKNRFPDRRAPAEGENGAY